MVAVCAVPLTLWRREVHINIYKRQREHWKKEMRLATYWLTELLHFIRKVYMCSDCGPFDILAQCIHYSSLNPLCVINTSSVGFIFILSCIDQYLYGLVRLFWYIHVYVSCCVRVHDIYCDQMLYIRWVSIASACILANLVFQSQAITQLL